MNLRLPGHILLLALLLALLSAALLPPTASAQTSEQPPQPIAPIDAADGAAAVPPAAPPPPAQVWEALVNRPPQVALQIPGLTMPAKVRVVKGKAILSGAITGGKWKVTKADPYPLRVAQPPQRGFKVLVEFDKPTMDVVLVATDGKDGTIDEKIQLSVPKQSWWAIKREADVAKAAAPKPGKASESAWEIVPSVGVTYFTYTQTGFAEYSAAHLTIKGSLGRKLGERWSIQGSVYANALPLFENTTETLEFLGVNGRLGYKLPWVSGRWDARVWLGGYFLTMDYAQTAYGFKNLSGPQAFLSAKYVASKRGRLSFYFKLAPIVGFDLGSGEFAFGLGWTQITGWLPILFGLDYASLQLDDAATGTVGVSESFSFSVGVPL